MEGLLDSGHLKIGNKKIKSNWSENGTHDTDIMDCVLNYWKYQDLGNDHGSQRLR